MYYFLNESPSPQLLSPHQMSFISHTTGYASAFDPLASFRKRQVLLSISWRVATTHIGLKKFFHFMTETADSLRKEATKTGWGGAGSPAWIPR